MKPFKPMLASPVDLEKLRYPVIVSPKLDGIRCVITPEGPKTRMLKDVPNDYIREALNHPTLFGLDGEIMTYTNGKADDFNTIQGNVMRKDGQPEFLFVVFDDFTHPLIGYSLRYGDLAERKSNRRVSILKSYEVETLEGIMEHEKRSLEAGYEGLMIRDIDGMYKFGRATANGQELLKMKRFFDMEAKIIGFTERMHNANVATVGELGQTKRSSHKENMVPTGSLGTFTVSIGTADFDIGTGFTDTQRHAYWNDRDDLLGKTITFKYQEMSKYGVPRFPVFIGFRYDLEE